MSSNRRRIASRLNGAQSKGPITPAGKTRSARNATRHGLMAKCVILDNESQEGFDTLLAGFVERFAPADGVELGLVEEMFSAFWRQRRAWAIETHLMNGAIATQPLEQDELTRLTEGFNSIASQPPLELMHRYETRLHRIFQRALANLILMRSLQELTPPAENTSPNEVRSPIRAPNVREGSCEAPQPPPPAENIKLQNEPSPISGQFSAPESVGDPPTLAPTRPSVLL